VPGDFDLKGYFGYLSGVWRAKVVVVANELAWPPCLRVLVADGDGFNREEMVIRAQAQIEDSRVVAGARTELEAVPQVAGIGAGTGSVAWHLRVARVLGAIGLEPEDGLVR
jgi:hypothetical protein